MRIVVPNEEVSPSRASVEFAALLLACLLAYGVQELVSELAARIIAIPLYVTLALFFLFRGPALAKANGRVMGSLLGSRVGRASEAASRVAFRVIGLGALALIPIALLLYVVEA